MPDAREGSERPVAASRRPARRRRGSGKGPVIEVHLTSQSITRGAYQETRAWLLAQHGPVCAYCGRRWTAGVMTLDHVQPRRGQVAYDRRDNLVLACPGCNTAKRDLSPTAYLLAARVRAANLLRYGAHLSPMLLELARSLAPAAALETLAVATTHGSNGTNGSASVRAPTPMLDDGWDDGESPYRD